MACVTARNLNAAEKGSNLGIIFIIFSSQYYSFSISHHSGISPRTIVYLLSLSVPIGIVKTESAYRKKKTQATQKRTFSFLPPSIISMKYTTPPHAPHFVRARLLTFTSHVSIVHERSVGITSNNLLSNQKRKTLLETETTPSLFLPFTSNRRDLLSQRASSAQSHNLHDDVVASTRNDASHYTVAQVLSCNRNH